MEKAVNIGEQGKTISLQTDQDFIELSTELSNKHSNTAQKKKLSSRNQTDSTYTSIGNPLKETASVQNYFIAQPQSSSADVYPSGLVTNKDIVQENLRQNLSGRQIKREVSFDCDKQMAAETKHIKQEIENDFCCSCQDDIQDADLAKSNRNEVVELPLAVEHSMKSKIDKASKTVEDKSASFCSFCGGSVIEESDLNFSESIKKETLPNVLSRNLFSSEIGNGIFHIKTNNSPIKKHTMTTKMRSMKQESLSQSQKCKNVAMKKAMDVLVKTLRDCFKKMPAYKKVSNKNLAKQQSPDHQIDQTLQDVLENAPVCDNVSDKNLVDETSLGDLEKAPACDKILDISPAEQQSAVDTKSQDVSENLSSIDNILDNLAEQQTADLTHESSQHCLDTLPGKEKFSDKNLAKQQTAVNQTNEISQAGSKISPERQKSSDKSHPTLPKRIHLKVRRNFNYSNNESLFKDAVLKICSSEQNLPDEAMNHRVDESEPDSFDHSDVQVPERQGTLAGSSSPGLVEEMVTVEAESVNGSVSAEDTDTDSDTGLYRIAETNDDCLVVDQVKKRNNKISRKISKGCKSYKCAFCDQESSTQNDLELHVQDNHNKKKLFDCRFCNKVFYNESIFNAHVKRFHGKESRIMSKPNDSDSASRKLELKIGAKSSCHQCSHCKETFSHEILLDMHKNMKKCSNNSKPNTSSEKTDAPEYFYVSKITNRKEVVSQNNEKANVIATMDDLKKDISNGKFGDEEQGFRCLYCPKLCTKRKQLERHLQRHVGEKQYVCNLCCKAVAFYHLLEIHLETHNVEKSFKCSHCAQSFILKESLEKHISKFHPKKRKYFRSIDKTVGKKSRKGVKRKEESGNKKRVSQNLRGFSCQICGKIYQYQSLLDIHIKRHKKERNYQCDLCDKAFYCNYRLKDHMNVHTGKKPYTCAICGQTFHQYHGMDAHRRLQHANNKFIIHKCDICGKEYKSSGTLRDHKIHAHRDVKKVFPCPLCGKTYSKRPTMRRHMVTHNDDAKIFKCSVCDYATYYKWQLAVHSRTHTNERPYKCPHCDKAFIIKRSLEYHIDIHHTETKTFQCPQCPKKFNSKFYITTHLRTHTGNRPYKCAHCNKTYTLKVSMLRHIEKKHKGVA